MKVVINVRAIKKMLYELSFFLLLSHFFDLLDERFLSNDYLISYIGIIMGILRVFMCLAVAHFIVNHLRLSVNTSNGLDQEDREKLKEVKNVILNRIRELQEQQEKERQSNNKSEEKES
jgi:hypothetical protein